MTEIAIYNDATLQSALGAIRQAYATHKRVRVRVSGPLRSLPQNSLSHEIYAQLARELPEDDAAGHKAYCKLHHGVPILRAEDAEFRAVYDSAIKGLSYEQKLGVMRILPVTSLMNRVQKTKYLDAVRDDFAARGVFLSFPEA